MVKFLIAAGLIYFLVRGFIGFSYLSSAYAH